MNIEYYTLLGWTLVAAACIFALGVIQPFARRFYPGSPTVPQRLAAPLILGGLAATCFLGFGREALLLTAAIGLTLIVFNRWTRQRDKLAAGPANPEA